MHIAFSIVHHTGIIFIMKIFALKVKNQNIFMCNFDKRFVIKRMQITEQVNVRVHEYNA